MDERTLRALAEAGAVKAIRIIAQGSRFHVEAETLNGCVTASTLKGAVKTWRTIDAAAKWVRGLGIANMSIDVARWQPSQRSLGV